MTDGKNKLIASIKSCDSAFLVTVKDGNGNVELLCGSTEKDIAEEIPKILAVHLDFEIENEDFPPVLSNFIDIVADDPEFGICDDCKQKVEDEIRLSELN